MFFRASDVFPRGIRLAGSMLIPIYTVIFPTCEFAGNMMRFLDVFGNVMFPLTFTSGLSIVLRSSGDGHRFMQAFINTSIIVHFLKSTKL